MNLRGIKFQAINHDKRGDIQYTMPGIKNEHQVDVPTIDNDLQKIHETYFNSIDEQRNLEGLRQLIVKKKLKKYRYYCEKN